MVAAYGATGAGSRRRRCRGGTPSISRPSISRPWIFRPWIFRPGSAEATTSRSGNVSWETPGGPCREELIRSVVTKGEKNGRVDRAANSGKTRH